MGPLPLKGLKVLDLSRVLAGPFCTQILGDLGADVIKIEEPRHGDDTRSWLPPEFEGLSTYYLSTNRNKRSMAADLKNPEDLKKVRRLAEKADVLVENFKVGGLKKFGLDYQGLKAQNPRLIYCSITGYGQTGPRAHEPGYDFLIQAMGGFMSITGPDEKHPTKVGVAVIDIATGLYAAVGILAALRERDQSGLGQAIDLSLLEVDVALLSYLAMNFMATQQAPKAIGNLHPTITPYQSFRTQDLPIVVTIGNDLQFQNFCEALKTSWHQDPRFSTNEHRTQNQKELEALIEECLLRHPQEYWIKKFHGKGFPFGPIWGLDDLAKDPQMIERKVLCKMDDQKTPNIRSPLHLSRTPIETYRPPPSLNQDPDADFF